MRTILVHLNIEVEDNDRRSADDIATQAEEATRAALYANTLIGNHLSVAVPLAEEV